MATLHSADDFRTQLTGRAHAIGRGARDATEEEDGAVFLTDQDDDDEHVKLLNPVKVGILLGATAGSDVQAGTLEFIELNSHGTSSTCPWFTRVTLQGEFDCKYQIYVACREGYVLLSTNSITCLLEPLASTVQVPLCHI